MFPRMVGGCLFIVTFACAAPNRNAVPADFDRVERSPGLFLGHTEYGETVVAATHYDAMVGLATTDAELGLPTRGNVAGLMRCAREMVTGSHFPHWICRYDEEAQASRERVQNYLVAPRLANGRSGHFVTSSTGRPGGGVPY
jgi:hypothetical protein